MPFPRISARKGQVVDLCSTFYRGGVPTDPYAIRKVSIYRNAVLPHNLLETIHVVDPWDPLYPAPLTVATQTIPAGYCGTGPETGAIIPGDYCLPYTVPCDAVAPDAYFDVWSYYPDNPCDVLDLTGEDGTAPPGCTDVGGVTESLDLDSPEYQCLLVCQCNRFWVYPDNWFASDGLQTVRFGFEPLDMKFRKPEVRPLEIGLMPLPLYDYNFNLVTPLIPFLTASISVETQHRELLVNSEPLSIGLRQGSYRTNPFVLKWNLDTSRFLIGTYRYRVTIYLPDGSTRASQDFIFTIS